MATENTSLPYNYSRLDRFLKNDYPLPVLVRMLNRIKGRLVDNVGHDESYSAQIGEEYYVVDELEDIFDEMGRERESHEHRRN